MLATLNPYTGIYKNKSCNYAICLHHGITFSSASITQNSWFTNWTIIRFYLNSQNCTLNGTSKWLLIHTLVHLFYNNDALLLTFAPGFLPVYPSDSMMARLVSARCSLRMVRQPPWLFLINKYNFTFISKTPFLKCHRIAHHWISCISE